MSIILFNKPFDVLCQFTDENAGAGAAARQTLANYIQNQPGYYAAGRLDRDSEGLLLLTNDGKLQHKVSHPRHKLAKTYLAQVEGDIDDASLRLLATGVLLKDGKTAPASAIRIDEPDWIWPRTPPIRKRAAIPTSWVQISLTEGRNRQVRRMTAATGHPTLRLIRTDIGQWSIKGVAPGQWVSIA